MVEMTNGQGENMDDKKVSKSDSNQRKWNVFDGSIHYIFHPVVSQVGSKAHLLDRMMHFVKLP